MRDDVKRLGFGFMRLPLKGHRIDIEKTNEMVDEFMKKGGRLFDTAYQYLDEKSESAIRKCVVERYPREEFLLADKMPVYTMKATEDPYEIFETQLERCGVDYFDYYLVHDPEERYYDGICRDLEIFEAMCEFKRQGRVKKLGLSLHDTPEVLDRILTEHPEIEFVLLQINYRDWGNSALKTRQCYEVACLHGKPVWVMGPVKGGQLARVNSKVKNLFKNYDRTPAEWALSFVFGLDNVEVVLSGMSSLNEVRGNMEFLADFKKSDMDMKVLGKARDLMRNSSEIACTTCDYCKNHCPEEIPISAYFDLYNLNKKSVNLDCFSEYERLSDEFSRASDCIECGECEETCPQHLNISRELKKVVELFEN